MDITGLGSLFSFGSKVIDKIFPDKDAANKAKLELFRLEQAGDLKEIELEYKAMTDQVAINKEEAKSSSLFVSGWRPAVGWTCGLGLAYSVFIRPIAGIWVEAPEIDTGVIIQLLFAMLGVAGMRTLEKMKGVASK